jgi:hypothetical protein
MVVPKGVPTISSVLLDLMKHLLTPQSKLSYDEGYLIRGLR